MMEQRVQTAEAEVERLRAALSALRLTQRPSGSAPRAPLAPVHAPPQARVRGGDGESCQHEEAAASLYSSTDSSGSSSNRGGGISRNAAPKSSTASKPASNRRWM
mmetsp:Transcript_17123/g.56015  ORF Transcript_17123/g.56015 Transcript_17123/m.56015 type:complete len:105 (+) Transcript_17123:934-1248(+)